MNETVTNVIRQLSGKRWDTIIIVEVRKPVSTVGDAPGIRQLLQLLQLLQRRQHIKPRPCCQGCNTAGAKWDIISWCVVWTKRRKHKQMRLVKFPSCGGIQLSLLWSGGRDRGGDTMISFVVWTKRTKQQQMCFVNFPGHGGIQFSLLKSANRSPLCGDAPGILQLL